MLRKPEQSKKACTNPDHRPMLPESRKPCDKVDDAVREVRRRIVDCFPIEYRKWR